MSNLRVAVIGVGHLGAIHARLLKQRPGVELVGVVDPSEAARTAVANELNVPALADYVELRERIEGAIIATPSRQHHAVAVDLLAHGVHVFVEKPMTLNVGDADDLIAEAASRRLVLQIGHVERFNPAFTAAASHLGDPKYIEAVRSGPFTCRSTDIGVVLDLMIHDIDAILALVDDRLVNVEAMGAAVLGPNEDWAQARLTFAGGCVANMFSSRVSWHSQRSMQVICRDCVARIDFGGKQASVMRISDAVSEQGFDATGLAPQEKAHVRDHLFSDYLPLTQLSITDVNPLADEHREFIAAMRGEQPVTVSGRDGRRALDVAERILTSIAAHRWDGAAEGAIGPRYAMRDAVLRGPHWRQPIVRRKAG